MDALSLKLILFALGCLAVSGAIMMWLIWRKVRKDD